MWFLLIAGLSGFRLQAQTPTNSAFRLIGYLPEYRVGGFDPQAASGLTDLILFSAEPTAEGGLDLGRLGSVPWTRFQDFRERTQVRLLLAVGGWGHSRHFGKVSTNAVLRQAFVDAVLRTCGDRKLDGIDLDWEHPANPAEEEGYGLLTEALHERMAPRGLTLSVTVAGWQRLTPRLIQASDLVQLMAYDQPGAHSTFEGAQSDVAKLLKMGVPRSKLVLGVPFYGRHRTQRDRTPTYREIVERSSPAPDVDEVDGICFNGPVTLQRKHDYAVGEGMAGVMVWEIGQDAAGESGLLQILAKRRAGQQWKAMADGRRISMQALQTLGGQLMAALVRGGPTNAIGICSTRALDLTDLVGRSNRVTLTRVSHAPRNPANMADGLELDLIRQFQSEMRAAGGLPGTSPSALIRTNSGGNRVFYAPVVLSNPLCLQCHGQLGTEIATSTADALRRLYPVDRATGFRVGDVRGMWKVEFGLDP